ncbi:uncharacterized protein HGUI_00707 [Hanseniaspora guilliermondii]|uniref:glucan endo-1,3-beta-D-glucosidase n=1 Tax=Hanseniaspora guilliermondii TaxID=56406 RepID=A0A1L0B0L7_9ASCO|nr:uncharacterized protein HGUI_00707 [Hanseniaspora guilliermondii]
MQNSNDEKSKSFEQDISNTDTDVNTNTEPNASKDTISANLRQSQSIKSFYLGSAAIQLNSFDNNLILKDNAASSTFEAYLNSSKSSSPSKLEKLTNINSYNLPHNEDHVVFPGDSSASDDIQYNNFDTRLKRDESLRSKTSNSQVSRNSSVRFNTNPVVIVKGVKDPSIKRWDSFSKRSILKDSTATPISLKTEKLDVLSKAPSGISSEAVEQTTNEKFLSMTGNLEEPIYMSSRNLQKSQDILTEMTHLNSELHTRYSDTGSPSENINIDNKMSMTYHTDEIPLNPFIPQASFNNNNDSKISDNKHPLSIERKYMKGSSNDTISMQDSNSSCHYNIGKKSKSKKTNTYAILMCISLTFLIAVIAIVIPFLVILSRGSETTVMHYFKHASPNGRNQTLHKILATYFNESMIQSDEKDKNERLSLNNSILDGKKHQQPSMLQAFNISMISTNLVNDTDIAKALSNISHTNTFDGINYTPQGILYPKCEVIAKDVILDLLTISNVTNKIKTSGVQCKQVRYIIEAIKMFNINLKISIGVLITKNDDFNNKQIDEVEYVLDNYPFAAVESIFVGNEVLNRNITDENTLIQYITRLKQKINEKGLNISVGTSELGGMISKRLIEASDVMGANIYPFFTGQVVQTSADWVFDYQQNELTKLIKEYPNKSIIITEVGWPYIGGKHKKAVAGPKHCQKFMSDFICKSKQKKINYFYSGAFDDPWKKVYYKDNNKWQTEWAIFNNQRTLKPHLTLPQCI